MNLIRLCTVVCTLTVGAQASGAAADADLRKNVQQVKLPGLVGALAVYGPEATTVLTAPLDDKYQAPIVAVGTFGKGRIVCTGHPGYITVEPTKQGDTGQLMSNLLLWAARSEGKPSKGLRLTLLDGKPLADALTTAGFRATSVAASKIAESLAACDVLIARPSKLLARDVPAIEEFVKKGGGLIMADAGWIWTQYEAKPGEQLADDFVGNRLANLAGIAWTPATVDNQDGMVTAAEPPALASARPALKYLTEHPRVEKSDAQGLQAAKTLELAVSALKSDDALLLPEVRKIAAAAAGNAIPSPRQPLKQADALARVAVSMETIRALNVAPTEAAPSALAAAFPGAPPPQAKAVAETISIDPAHPRWHSTGLYAAPGAVVTVQVPSTAANQKLALRIGCHTDQLWSHDSWKRAPQISRNTLITSAETKLTSGFGGLVYIDVPKNCPLEPFNVTISGAVPAPRFVLGQTTNSEWKKIREYPGPWAEIGSDRLILTVPSESIRNYDDPESLMRFWNRALDGCADLASIPIERASPERIVVDAQISAGYLHAGYPIMGPISTTAELLDLKTLESKGNWGYYHEIGHNHQQPEWTWDGLGEVTVNLFSLYLLDTLNPGAPYHDAIQPRNLEKMKAEFEKTGQLSGPFERLMPYIQLRAAFGWRPFQQVFAEYRELPRGQKPKTTQECKDQWLIRFSKAVNHDLGPFYDGWKMGMSDEAKQAVSHLPPWRPGTDPAPSTAGPPKPQAN